MDLIGIHDIPQSVVQPKIVKFIASVDCNLTFIKALTSLFIAEDSEK